MSDDYDINIVSKIFTKAAELHDGDSELGNKWMGTPNEDFNGYTPMQMCKPYEGAVKVRDYLDRKLAAKNNP